MNIKTKPEPSCPDCGCKMVLRRPCPGQDLVITAWDMATGYIRHKFCDHDREPFWGCSNYPDCRGTRQIMPDGTPEDDEISGINWWDD